MGSTPLRSIGSDAEARRRIVPAGRPGVRPSSVPTALPRPVSPTVRSLRATVVGRSAPTGLRVLLGSAPGFAAPQSFDDPRQVTAAGSVLVLHAERPGPDVTVLRTRLDPCPPILVVCPDADPAVAIDALRCGATSYLVDGEYTRGDFLAAITATIHGESAVSPRITTALVRRFHHGRPRPVDDHRLDRLTRRDRELLTLLAEGCSNLQIAARLCLAGKTVRNYMSQLYTKLEVSSRAEAIVWWLGQTGL